MAKKGVLKNKDKLQSKIVKSCVIAGVSLGLGASVAIFKPLPYDAESIYNRKMQQFEQANTAYMDEYSDDVKKAIQSTTNQNINMNTLQSELYSHVSNKYKAEAQNQSEVVKSVNAEKQEATVQRAILTLLTTTIGAAVGQGVGRGVASTVNAVNKAKDSAIKAKDAVKNFSFKGRRRKKDELLLDDDNQDYMFDEEQEIER